MLPSHQDLAINHATVSAPSSGSCTIGWNTPSDLNVPRQSWNTTAYPASTSSNTFGLVP